MSLSLIIHDNLDMLLCIGLPQYLQASVIVIKKIHTPFKMQTHVSFFFFFFTNLVCILFPSLSIGSRVLLFPLSVPSWFGLRLRCPQNPECIQISYSFHIKNLKRNSIKSLIKKISTSSPILLVLVYFSKRKRVFQYFRYHLHVDFPCQFFQRSPFSLSKFCLHTPFIRSTRWRPVALSVFALIAAACSQKASVFTALWSCWNVQRCFSHNSSCPLLWHHR